MTQDDEFTTIMTGDRMSPRFQDGEVLILSRDRKITHGCHAAIHLTDGRGLIGIVERHDQHRVRLRELNPPITHHLLAADIADMYRIVGTREAPE